MDPVLADLLGSVVVMVVLAVVIVAKVPRRWWFTTWTASFALSALDSATHLFSSRLVEVWYHLFWVAVGVGFIHRWWTSELPWLFGHERPRRDSNADPAA